MKWAELPQDNPTDIEARRMYNKFMELCINKNFDTEASVLGRNGGRKYYGTVF
jgi:hypothetical protein